MIGATSLLLLLGDLGRFTRDVDLTVALDFGEFHRLTNRLGALGWTPAPKLEHRWIAPLETIVDLLPAGAELRRGGSITWPENQFEMSLAGFNHVFARAVAVDLSGGLSIRVAPPIVTALLKIIAYVETHTGARRISRISESFCAAMKRKVIGCSQTQCSMRTFRISNSQTHFSWASICAGWRPAATPDSSISFSDAFWRRTKRGGLTTNQTSE